MKTNMHFGAYPVIFIYAKKLRNYPTRAEEKLWSYLRKHLTGYRFRRQHPMWKYVVDFYCHYLKLVIEIDGEIHLEPNVQDKDEEKEKDIKNLGLEIIRFINEEVLIDIDSVMTRLYQKIEEIKLQKFRSKNISKF
jgi:very-short-patch-repair endonuclease